MNSVLEQLTQTIEARSHADPSTSYVAKLLHKGEDAILKMADYIGSTTGLLKYTINNPANEFIVATESGIIHQMAKASPNKTFIPAPPNNSCACNDCPHMKRNTLEKLYLCLKNELPEINVSMDIILKAQKPIEKMLEISAKLGL